MSTCVVVAPHAGHANSPVLCAGHLRNAHDGPQKQHATALKWTALTSGSLDSAEDVRLIDAPLLDDAREIHPLQQCKELGRSLSVRFIRDPATIFDIYIRNKPTSSFQQCTRPVGRAVFCNTSCLGRSIRSDNVSVLLQGHRPTLESGIPVLLYL
jgi:hypothetical protein